MHQYQLSIQSLDNLYGIACKKFKNVRMTKEWNLYHKEKKVHLHILQLK